MPKIFVIRLTSAYGKAQHRMLLRTKRKKVLNTFSACLSFLGYRFMTIDYWAPAPWRGTAHRQWEAQNIPHGAQGRMESRKPAPSLRTWARISLFIHSDYGTRQVPLTQPQLRGNAIVWKRTQDDGVL